MNVLGLMSGTSLDGVDLACVSFSENNNSYSYKTICCQTISYTHEWKNKLKNIISASAESYVQTHVEYGHFLGELINNFIQKNKLSVDLIASHGHTIFHQPNKKFTSQIGDGAAISAITNLPVVCDFRSVDVALGGQGAPLVPVGDKFLFSEFDYCLNLGGIANISYDDEKNKRIAFDICPVNMALNYLCTLSGFDFDQDGKNAQLGSLNNQMLNQLNNLSFYNQPPPKSLGAEWFAKDFKTVLDNSTIPNNNKLQTVCVHIAQQISKVIAGQNKKMLVTGGGAHNSFLIAKIKQFLPQADVVIPSKEIIDFKEAIIFALLGYLRLNKKTNALSSVTGAIQDNCGGTVYDAFGKL